MLPCLHTAAEHWGVPQAQLTALYRHHQPPAGVGPMGIPVAWIPFLKKNGLSSKQLRSNTCANINAAAMILSAQAALAKDRVTHDKKPPACLLTSAQTYHVSYRDALHYFEQARAKPFSSQDYGPMRIPASWLPILRAAGFPEWRVKHQSCWNVAAGAWILAAESRYPVSSGHHAPFFMAGRIGIPNIPLSITADARAASAQTGVPAPLLMAVAWQESGFHPDAVSPAGAQGLMQFMPGTWNTYGRGSPFNPGQAMLAGARYLRHLALKFHSWPLALAGYNAGGHAVVNAGYRIPPFQQTQRYVPAVLAHYQQITGGLNR